METKDEIKIAKFVETQRAANDNDKSCQEDFDDLVLRASEGDRRAVGAIATALGKSLLEEARSVLKELDDEAGDVVQDFLLFLLEARAPFNRARGPAMKWMYRMVRTIAQQRRRERRRYRELRNDDDGHGGHDG